MDFFEVGGGVVLNIPKTYRKGIFGIFGIRCFDGGRGCGPPPPSVVLNIPKTYKRGIFGIFGTWWKTRGRGWRRGAPSSSLGGCPEYPDCHASIGILDNRDSGGASMRRAQDGRGEEVRGGRHGGGVTLRRMV